MKTILEYIDYKKIMKNPFSKLSDKMDLDEFIFIIKNYSNYKDISRQMKFVGRTIDGFDKNKQEYAILEINDKETRLAAYNSNYGKKKWIYTNHI